MNNILETFQRKIKKRIKSVSNCLKKEQQDDVEFFFAIYIICFLLIV